MIARACSNKPPSVSSLGRMRTLGAVILLAGVLLAGCSLKMRAGNKPDMTAFEHELVPGKTTRWQAITVLGWPYGEGRALMPFHDEPRDVLTYYYEEGTLKDDRRLFLFVFFNEGAYEGYMWFSSLEKN